MCSIFSYSSRTRTLAKYIFSFYIYIEQQNELTEKTIPRFFTLCKMDIFSEKATNVTSSHFSTSSSRNSLFSRVNAEYMIFHHLFLDLILTGCNDFHLIFIKPRHCATMASQKVYYVSEKIEEKMEE